MEKSEALSVEDLNQFISTNCFYEVSGPDGIHPGVQKNKSTENPHYSHTNTPNCSLGSVTKYSNQEWRKGKVM